MNHCFHALFAHCWTHTHKPKFFFHFFFAGEDHLGCFLESIQRDYCGWYVPGPKTPSCHWKPNSEASETPRFDTCGSLVKVVEAVRTFAPEVAGPLNCWCFSKNRQAKMKQHVFEVHMVFQRPSCWHQDMEILWIEVALKWGTKLLRPSSMLLALMATFPRHWNPNQKGSYPESSGVRFATRMHLNGWPKWLQSWDWRSDSFSNCLDYHFWTVASCLV